MKAISTAVLLLATVGACTRKNDVGTLRNEAVDVAQYYAPRVDALEARLQAIFKRGSTIPATVPGVDSVSAKLTEARDLVLNLRQVVAPNGMVKEAEDAARSHNVDRLEKMIHEREESLARGVQLVNEDLQAAESWIAQYDAHTLPTEGAHAAGSTPTPAPAPVQTEAATSPSATGQPPAAVQPAGAGAGAGSAASAGHGSAAPAHH